MTTRRTLLAGAASALVAPLAATWSSRAFADEHWVAGGTGGIQRAQYTYTGTSNNGGYKVIVLPATGVQYMIPITKNVFDESSGAKYRMTGDGCVTVLEDGLYDLTANLDWPAQARGSGQDGYDTNLRELFIQRVPVGTAPPVYTKGQVTPIAAGSVAYDIMASAFTPGSSVPNALRVSVTWAPGTIAAGKMAYTNVTLPAGGSFTPAVGDLALAGHSSLSDQVLGAANAGLVISARIVSAKVARVMIENRYNTSSVTIPSGTLNLIAESAVTSAGNSVDAWTWLSSGSVELLAGEKLMVVASSQSPGDFLQIDNSSFLRVSNVVPT